MIELFGELRPWESAETPGLIEEIEKVVKDGAIILIWTEDGWSECTVDTESRDNKRKQKP